MSDVEIKLSKVVGRSRSRKIISEGDVSQPTYHRPHKCPVQGCGKAFTRIEHLRRHQLNHKPRRTWKCEPCAATFARRDLWQRHVRVHHSSEYGDEAELSEGSDAVERNLSLNEDSITTETSVQHHHGSRSSSNNLTGTNDVFPSVAGSEKRWSSDTGEDINQKVPNKNVMDGSHWLMSHWDQREDDWNSAFASHDVSHFTSDDINWFMHNQYLPSLPPDLSLHQVHESTSESEVSVMNRPPGNLINREASEPPPPIYLHDSETKILMPSSGECDAPRCGFRICNALTDQHRFELLLALRNMAEVDTSDRMFSLNNMKQGIHLYSRNISIEHAIYHPEVLIPQCDESLRLVVDIFGSKTPPETLWAIISFGWTLLKSETGYEYNMATKIQRILRKHVISHPAFTLSPPLWLIQTLFLLLMFARYQGSREEYGFSTIFHGVLLDSVRRLDLRPERAREPADMNISPRRAWIEWIRADTLRRVILNTFIFDAKHAILHGSDLTMTPFELNVKLPFSDDAWYSTSPEEWVKVMKDDNREQLSFLAMLRRSWNPSGSGILPSDLPRGSTVILLGIISIAREIVRREENTFSTKSKHALLTLNNTVVSSLDIWKASWAQNQIRTGFQATFLWRTCYCLSRLAYTLYEIGPVDLQTIAGKEVIEGRRINASDYAKSKRKIRLWVKQDRALVGVSNAARVILERFQGTASSRIHCHHCFWCLFIAGLICFNFGFALTGTTHNHDLVVDGCPVSEDIIQEQCAEYLTAAVEVSDRSKTSNFELLNKTGAMLIMLIRLLRTQSGSGLIEESVEVLTRLVGLNDI